MSVFERDITAIYKSLDSLMPTFAGKRILLTGGTGVFGTWMLYLFRFINTQVDDSIKVEVVSRNPSNFLILHPTLLNQNWLIWNKSDIRNFVPKSKHFELVIHGATTSAAETYHGMDSLEKFSVACDGTKRVLSHLKKYHVERFLLISSGSVYGDSLNRPILESDSGAPLTTHTGSAIGHGKRAAEFLCMAFREAHPTISFNIARCFSFIGPYMPTDIHYAVGNFVESVCKGLPIVLKSDGSAVRSYLYMSDAVTWLMQILLATKEGEIYNVGAQKSITVRKLAELFATISGGKIIFDVKNSKGTLNTSAPRYYVPNTEKLQNHLEVTSQVNLREAIIRSIDSYKELSLNRVT
jgi:dTDP-glucose 4,6-dehydratase/UDP-glucose 4-epimerase